MRKSTVIAAIIFVFASLSPCTGIAEQLKLRINCTIHSPYEAFFVRLLEEICLRNNIVLQRCTPPIGRSLINVNQGKDDGDGPRIAGLSTAFPNIVCVPEPFGEFHFGAFAKSPKFQINGWAGLTGLNVAYIHGWKIFDNQVKSAKSITKVKNKDLLFKLLDMGRTDVAMITKSAGYEMVQKLNLKRIRFIHPPLAIKPNFLYLHKRHKDLAFRLAQILRDMKQKGTYDQLYKQMLSPYLTQENK